MKAAPKKAPPLVKGGQGRPDDTTGEAVGLAVALVFVLLSAFGLCAGVFQLITRKN